MTEHNTEQHKNTKKLHVADVMPDYVFLTCTLFLHRSLTGAPANFHATPMQARHEIRADAGLVSRASYCNDLTHRQMGPDGTG